MDIDEINRVIKHSVDRKATHLELIERKITLIPDEIGNIVSLNSLDLEHNSIKNLPDQIWSLINLIELNLGFNKIELISESIGKLGKLRKLYLNNNQIFSLPTSLSMLKQLESLRVQGNLFTDIPKSIHDLNNLIFLDISYNQLSGFFSESISLNKLETLYLQKNKIKEITDSINKLINLKSLMLYGNLISKVSFEISKLQKLKFINMSGNELIELPLGIMQLRELEELDISRNKLMNLDTDEIEHLEKIRKIYVQGNNIININANIGRLSNLTDLDLSENQIEVIPTEIGNLNNLSYLNLSNNRIQSLPHGIKKLTNLRRLDLRGNPIPIPPEILDLYDRPQSIFDAYFSSKLRPLHEAKLIFVGQGSVGKTSLIRRIVSDSFSTSEEKTDGIQITKQDVITRSKEKIHTNIWDFGGQEIMHSTHQFFLTKRSLYVLVLDSRLTQEENRVEYWLKIIQSFGGDSPVLIVGNKIDQHPLDIDRTGLQKKYPIVADVLETSAANGVGIDNFKKKIAELISLLPHIRDMLPDTWFSVKDELERMGMKSNFITHDKYIELCSTKEIVEENSQRTLIGFLHDLGVVLYFHDDRRLSELGILNPQWVTNGVYKILNSHALFQSKGTLTIPMLDDILSLPEYPRNKRLFIIDMMRKFELCFDIDNESFLVPDLLPKDEPYTGDWQDSLEFQYHYNVLPRSIMSRFIVRVNAAIFNTIWRSGVVLREEKDENTALVKADFEEKIISIWIKGNKKTRRNLLSTIRAEFNAIHKTIIKIEAREKIPVPTHPEIIVDYEHLINLERLGEASFIPEGLRERVSVQELLSGVISEAEWKINTHKLNETSPEITTTEPDILVSTLSEVKPQAKFFLVVKNILALPKPFGRFIFDVFGRHDSADTSSIIMGWIFIGSIILLFQGFVQIDSIINVFKDIWRFFFPVK